MRIRVYPGGQLGAEKDTLELAVFGGIDITRVNLGPITSIAPLTSVLALPFLFRSISHARATFDGSVGRNILDSLSEHGLRGLCFYDSGARSFYNTQRPIHAPEDMVGMKVRVPNSDIYVHMIRALGANATPIPFGEVYQALVQGVVDGAENNFPSYEGTRHFEAAQFYSLTRHVLAPEVLVASGKSWEKMGVEERHFLQEGAYQSVPIMRSQWDSRVEEARRRVVAAGVSIVEDLDQGAFEKAMTPVWDRFVTSPKMESIIGQIKQVTSSQPSEAINHD
jgi:tripartite ATP-independent transporter DctP family solute receptor